AVRLDEIGAQRAEMRPHPTQLVPCPADFPTDRPRVAEDAVGRQANRVLEWEGAALLRRQLGVHLEQDVVGQVAELDGPRDVESVEPVQHSLFVTVAERRFAEPPVLLHFQRYLWFPAKNAAIKHYTCPGCLLRSPPGRLSRTSTTCTAA